MIDEHDEITSDAATSENVETNDQHEKDASKKNEIGRAHV